MPGVEAQEYAAVDLPIRMKDIRLRMAILREGDIGIGDVPWTAQRVTNEPSNSGHSSRSVNEKHEPVSHHHRPLPSFDLDLSEAVHVHLADLDPLRAEGSGSKSARDRLDSRYRHVASPTQTSPSRPSGITPGTTAGGMPPRSSRCSGEASAAVIIRYRTSTLGPPFGLVELDDQRSVRTLDRAIRYAGNQFGSGRLRKFGYLGGLMTRDSDRPYARHTRFRPVSFAR